MSQKGKAPDLPGFDFVRPLGSGGFADVFLYQQELPRRQVAVKVLHDGVGENAATTFTSEANLMAQLSAHPAIVTIFHAAIAGDGRPYMVMEYYPKPNLSVRSRRQALSVDESLDIMIRICAAVETAHRAGIIHRDIKPANILMSAYDKPGLTDFGISAAKDDLAGGESGLSIPWSAPEVVDESGEATESSDVFSLAATLHTLLAGRSPYEVAGSKNTHLDILSRITSDKFRPRIDRPDVPVGLSRVISSGLGTNPSDRPHSAADFARMLQEVEVSLRLPVTPLDVLDDGSRVVAEPPGSDEDDDDATRFRAAQIVSAQSQGGSRVRGPIIGSDSAAVPETVARAVDGDATRVRAGHRVEAQKSSPITGVPLRPSASRPSPDHGAEGPRSDATVTQGDAPSGSDAAPDEPGGHRKWVKPLLGVGVTAVLAGAVALGFASVSGHSGGSDAASSRAITESDSDALVVTVPPPTDLQISGSGKSRIATWRVASPQDGDTFQWKRTDPDGNGTKGLSDTPKVSLAVSSKGERPCLDVWLVRNGVASGVPASGCQKAIK